jgi:HAD superfamily hydrolase (TIGR01549 family)
MDRPPPRPPRPFRLEAVLFDFDGTLTQPDGLDFAAIKREVGCPPERYVLEFIEALPVGERRDQAFAALERFELEGAAQARPNAGAEEAVRRVRRHGLKVGVITRNGRPAIDCALANFEGLDASDFDVIVTRDDPFPPKPAPDGVTGAAAAMGVDPARVLVVGDFVLDALAGRAAGAVTAYLTNGEFDGDAAPAEARGATGSPADVEADPPAAAGYPDEAACDFVVGSLDELDAVVRLGLPLAQGKLPADLLAACLGEIGTTDPSIIVGASLGEDVAALDIAGDEVLVAHGDPITLTSADLGRYAVIVNANDIATSGAEPRWLLATVLLPAGTSPAEALHVLGEIAATCRDQGIAPIGGHTEITAAVNQPVVCGTMLGVLRRADLRDKRGAREGDRILLTKALAVEGTALLATELGDRLRALGMGDDELARCRAFAESLSVVPEARVAAGFAGARAMHDVTEGGLATALAELSAACGRELVVEHDAIPVLAETERVCALLGADPLGLIGSGSLLICCAPEEADALRDALGYAGVKATDIGALGRPGAGVNARADGGPVDWPVFAVDEAARLLAD